MSSAPLPPAQQAEAEELAAHIAKLQKTVAAIVAKGKKLGVSIANTHDGAIVKDLRKKLGLG